MNNRGQILILAACAILLAAFAFPMVLGTAQESQDNDLPKRVAELEKVVLDQQMRIKQLETVVAKLNRLATALAAGAQILDQSVDLSRKEGFEFAGPNPHSKTTLLEGLKHFAASVHKVVKPKEKKASEEEGGE
jgi:hypothetical protein